MDGQQTTTTSSHWHCSESRSVMTLKRPLARLPERLQLHRPYSAWQLCHQRRYGMRFASRPIVESAADTCLQRPLQRQQRHLLVRLQEHLPQHQRNDSQQLRRQIGTRITNQPFGAPLPFKSESRKWRSEGAIRISQKRRLMQRATLSHKRNSRLLLPNAARGTCRRVVRVRSAEGRSYRL